MALTLACAGEGPAPAGEQGVVAKDSPEAAPGTILFVGTSLTAGYGLDPAEAWPALIEAKLAEAKEKLEKIGERLSGLGN